MHSRLLAPLAALLITLLGACSGSPPPRPWPQRSPVAIRAQLLTLLPPRLEDREGWARDIETSFTRLDLLPSTDNLCAVLAVIEQETGYVANPGVPGLGRIARGEIERRAAELHVPKLAVTAALKLPSGNGRTFEQRFAALRTEKDMSDLFEELIDRVPLGKRLFADANPVRTGGAMQVAIAFAERHASEHPYPYAGAASIRDEVFRRRGGVYFGIAHLLQYPASYDRHLYRYADFNAGWYASRNAAFQLALSRISGIELVPDGDLVLPDAGLFDRRRSRTEQAAVSLAQTLGLRESRILDDLQRQDERDFEDTDTWRAVFEHADRDAGARVPRAALPQIALKSPKITRKLTTAWFADRVQTRYRACINRAYQAEGGS